MVTLLRVLLFTLIGAAALVGLNVPAMPICVMLIAGANDVEAETAVPIAARVAPPEVATAGASELEPLAEVDSLEGARLSSLDSDLELPGVLAALSLEL